MKIKVLIVDDEPPARSMIGKLLSDDSEIEIVGECANGVEAIESLDKLRPDLLFLDIQMPELDGFEVLEALDEKKIPEVIFVTAFDHYAVRAFDISAVDYLLKPFDHERMAKALARAKTKLAERRDFARNQDLIKLLKELRSRETKIRRFVVKDRERVLLIPVENIDWIKADGNYLLLHEQEKRHIIRKTMKQIALRLDPEKFVRIHRSTIVNLERVKELHVNFKNQHAVVLKNGTELILSRKYREDLSRRLGMKI